MCIGIMVIPSMGIAIPIKVNHIVCIEIMCIEIMCIPIGNRCEVIEPLIKCIKMCATYMQCFSCYGDTGCVQKAMNVLSVAWLQNMAFPSFDITSNTPRETTATF